MTHEEIVEALHRAHLTHLGEDPDIVEDCAQCAMYAEWAAPLILQGQSEGWVSGVHTGSSRAMRKMSDEPSLPLATEADNPYVTGSIMDDVDGDLAEQEDIVRARAEHWQGDAPDWEVRP
jgi:hypothetical protein